MRSPTEVMDGWSRGISGSVVHVDRIVHVEHVWGTAISVRVGATAGRADDALAALGECLAFFRRVDDIFSTYRPETEASFYRNGLSWRGSSSREFSEVLDACEEARRITRGAFDPWAVAGGFDPSGLVKGWAAGRASALLSARGFPHNLVNAGGDIYAAGDEDPGSGAGWPVGIVNPTRPSEVVEVVSLRDAALATSGRYERGNHVIDPRTSVPVTSVDSATVIGPDAGLADAFASAALVDGVASTAWFAGLGAAWSMHVIIGNTAHAYGGAWNDTARS